MISISFQAAKMVFGAILANLSQIGKVHDTGGVEFWREPARAGWLMKRGDVVRTWRRRWFVLKDGKLFWFLDSNVTSSGKTLGGIDMNYCLSSTSAFENTGDQASLDITSRRQSHVCGAAAERRNDEWPSPGGACSRPAYSAGA